MNEPITVSLAERCITFALHRLNPTDAAGIREAIKVGRELHGAVIEMDVLERTFAGTSIDGDILESIEGLADSHSDDHIAALIRLPKPLVSKIVRRLQLRKPALPAPDTDNPIAGQGSGSPPGPPAGADAEPSGAGATHRHGRGVRIPDEVRAAAKIRYERGDVVSEIAADIPCHPNTIAGWAEKGGWTRPDGARHTGWSAGRKRVFTELWLGGGDAERIAGDMTGRGWPMQAGTVAAAAHALGIEHHPDRRAALEQRRRPVAAVDTPAPEGAPEEAAPPRPIEGEIIEPGKGPPRADSLTFAAPVNFEAKRGGGVPAPSQRPPAPVGTRRDVLQQLGGFRRGQGPGAAPAPAAGLPELEPKPEHHRMDLTDLTRALLDHGYAVERIQGGSGLHFKIGDCPTPYALLGLRRVLAALDARGSRGAA